MVTSLVSLHASYFLDLRYASLPWPEAVRSARMLSPYELQEFQQVSPRQRAGWLASRWLIKRVVNLRLQQNGAGLDEREISTLSLDESGRPMRPLLWVASSRLPWSASIAHATQGVLIAVARSEDLLVGVDLTDGNHEPGGWDLWYTGHERQRLAATADADEAGRVWAIKQSFFKATNRGEPFRPRQYEVSRDDDGNYSCQRVGQRPDASVQITTSPCGPYTAALTVVTAAANRLAVPLPT